MASADCSTAADGATRYWLALKSMTASLTEPTMDERQAAAHCRNWHPPRRHATEAQHAGDSPTTHLCVTYAWSVAAADLWVRQHCRQWRDGSRCCTPVGFDLEWKPSFVAGTPCQSQAAVLQLAVAGGQVLLLHLRTKTSQARASRPSSQLTIGPGDLLDLLTDNVATAKVGVGIQMDADRLWNDNSVAINGTVDLIWMARRCYTLALEQLLGSEVVTRYFSLQCMLKDAKCIEYLCAKYPSLPVVQFVDVTDSACSCGRIAVGSQLDLAAIAHYFDQLTQLQVDAENVRNTVKQLSRIVAKPPPDSAAATSKPKLKQSMQDKFPGRPSISLPKYPHNTKNSLVALAERFLHVQLPKDRKVSLSDWEVYPLNERQVAYAALDAWAGHQIYLRIVEEIRHLLTSRGMSESVIDHYVVAMVKEATKQSSKS